jgi:holin-like protein
VLGGLLVLLAFALAGEAAVWATGAPVPGNVVGMVALAVALRRGWLSPEAVRPASGVLLRHLALFFVPPGVGLMAFGDVIGAEWPAIVVSNAVGLVAVLVAVGWTHERLAGRPGPSPAGGDA